jgi:hypothetical protein
MLAAAEMADAVVEAAAVEAAEAEVVTDIGHRSSFHGRCEFSFGQKRCG